MVLAVAFAHAALFSSRVTSLGSVILFLVVVAVAGQCVVALRLIGHSNLRKWLNQVVRRNATLARWCQGTLVRHKNFFDIVGLFPGGKKRTNQLPNGFCLACGASRIRRDHLFGNSIGITWLACGTFSTHHAICTAGRVPRNSFGVDEAGVVFVVVHHCRYRVGG